MKTIEIDILNPKATKLLQALADLKLIAIKPKKNSFDKVIAGFRERAATKGDLPSIDEITAEVEAVRTRRFSGQVL